MKVCGQRVTEDRGQVWGPGGETGHSPRLLSSWGTLPGLGASMASYQMPFWGILHMILASASSPKSLVHSGPCRVGKRTPHT